MGTTIDFQKSPLYIPIQFISLSKHIVSTYSLPRLHVLMRIIHYSCMYICTAMSSRWPQLKVMYAYIIIILIAYKTRAWLKKFTDSA